MPCSYAKQGLNKMRKNGLAIYIEKWSVNILDTLPTLMFLSRRSKSASRVSLNLHADLNTGLPKYLSKGISSRSSPSALVVKAETIQEYFAYIQ